jgi:hypothetical protein
MIYVIYRMYIIGLYMVFLCVHRKIELKKQINYPV